jgi:hypothetical protein
MVQALSNGVREGEQMREMREMVQELSKVSGKVSKPALCTRTAKLLACKPS